MATQSQLDNLQSIISQLSPVVDASTNPKITNALDFTFIGSRDIDILNSEIADVDRMKILALSEKSQTEIIVSLAATSGKYRRLKKILVERETIKTKITELSFGIKKDVIIEPDYTQNILDSKNDVSNYQKEYDDWVDQGSDPDAVRTGTAIERDLKKAIQSQALAELAKQQFDSDLLSKKQQYESLAKDLALYSWIYQEIMANLKIDNWDEKDFESEEVGSMVADAFKKALGELFGSNRFTYSWSITDGKIDTTVDVQIPTTGTHSIDASIPTTGENTIDTSVPTTGGDAPLTSVISAVINSNLVSKLKAVLNTSLISTISTLLSSKEDSRRDYYWGKDRQMITDAFVTLGINPDDALDWCLLYYFGSPDPSKPWKLYFSSPNVNTLWKASFATPIDTEALPLWKDRDVDSFLDYISQAYTPVVQAYMASKGITSQTGPVLKLDNTTRSECCCDY